MVSTVSTVAYLGLEARSVEVQCQIAPGFVGFTVVGLPDKAVAESRERVRAAISALGLALRPKRITINLSPADLPKEGSHYDLPIALALLGAMGLADAEALVALCGGGRTRARRPGCGIPRRASCRAPRLLARHGADMSGGARTGGRLGRTDRGGRGT